MSCCSLAIGSACLKRCACSSCRRSMPRAQNPRAWIDGEQYHPGTCRAPAAHVHAGGQRHGGAQIHPEGSKGELMDCLSPKSSAYDSRGIAPSAAGANAGHGRRHPRRQVKVLGKSKNLKALQVTCAGGRGIGTPMAKKQPTAADQRQDRAAGESAAPNRRHHRIPRLRCWAWCTDALRPVKRISSRWLGTEALMLRIRPTGPPRSWRRICSWPRSNVCCRRWTGSKDDEALANAVLDVREVTRTRSTTYPTM